MENSLERQKKKSWAESFVLLARERLRLLLVAMFSGEQRRSGSALNVSQNKLQPDSKKCCNHNCRQGRDCPLR